MENWKDNISFILIEPKEPGNIGASARAMKNMGFRRLELVRPADFLSDESKCMAYNAFDILANATVHSRFNDAIKDKSLIIGTTRRLGKRRGLILPLTASVNRIIKSARKNKIAILFGREDKGLTNQEVKKCGFLITIPADPFSPSLNLSQSVLLVAYELSKKTFKTAFPELVQQKERDALYRHISSTLKLLEYIPRGDRDIEAQIMKNIKYLLGRSGLTRWEFNMLRGICSQIEKKVKSSHF